MRKYIPYISISILGMAAAIFVTSLITYKLSSMAVAKSAPSSALTMPVPPIRTLSADRNIFGALLEDKVAPQTPVAMAATIPPSKLLLMGLIADGPRPSAMIRNMVGDSIALFRVGARVFAASEYLARIDVVNVTLKGPYGTRKLELGVPSDQLPALIESKVPPPDGGASFNFSRSEMNGSVQIAEQILGQSKIGPEIRGGKIVGFRVAEVSDNSILKKMGMLAGDIIKSINGQALDSLERTTQIWEQIKRASEIHMVVERSGQEKLLSYYVRP